MPLEHRIGEYSGPLDFLLALIARERLDVAQLSLLAITDEYVAYARSNAVPPEEAADWLLVASKLLLIKARAIAGLRDAADEDGLEAELLGQLEALRAFKEAEKAFAAAWTEAPRLAFRTVRLSLPAEKTETKLPDGFAAAAALLMGGMMRRLRPLAAIPRAIMRKVISVQEKMEEVVRRVTDAARFRELLSPEADRHEALVLFLALLELLKQRAVAVEQDGHGSELRVMVQR